MVAAVEALRSNWSTVADAPWAFLLMAVVVAGGVWVAVSWQKAKQIDDLNSRLSLRDDEIADYRRKLDGASPDEAKAQMAALHAAIERLKPRSVEAQKREQITRMVAGKGRTISIATDMACADGPRVVTGLAAAFRSAGWQVETPSVGGPRNPPLSGLGLRVFDPASLSPAEEAVAAALRTAGLNFEVQGEPYRHPQFSEVEVELLISSVVHD